MLNEFPDLFSEDLKALRKRFWIAIAITILVSALSFIFPELPIVQWIQRLGGIAVNTFYLSILVLSVIMYIMFKLEEGKKNRQYREKIEKQDKIIADLQRENEELKSKVNGSAQPKQTRYHAI